MFILPFVDSILKRGEDGRAVKNGMSSFTYFEKKKILDVGVGVGVRLAWRSRGLSPLLVMFMRRVYIFRANAEVRVFLLQRPFVGNVPLCRWWSRQA